MRIFKISRIFRYIFTIFSIFNHEEGGKVNGRAWRGRGGEGGEFFICFGFSVISFKLQL